ncbi:hypothetical protein D1872_327700 [compost metagenome]
MEILTDALAIEEAVLFVDLTQPVQAGFGSLTDVGHVVDVVGHDQAKVNTVVTQTCADRVQFIFQLLQLAHGHSLV